MNETPLKVAIIGTGRPHNTEDSTGWGMSHAHARGYNASDKARIVALCDIVPTRAQLFNDEHAEGQAQVFTDYEKMLADVQPDIVSICTWPHLHAPMVIACARAGVRAIHCEKPMAPTWGEARAMVQASRDNNVQLTFDHQRRFLDSFASARQQIADGAIGELRRLEGACPNMFDWGTHWLDMFGFFNDETPAEWVLAQVDARRPVVVYGVQMETQGMAQIHYANGVTGLLFTGASQDAVGCQIRAVGTEGMIELHPKEPTVRIRGRGDAEMRPLEVTGGLHGNDAITRGIADLIESLQAGKKPLLSAENALQSTEVLFAIYESARRRGRADLPLTIEDSPFRAMIEEGVFPEARVEGDVQKQMIR